MSDNLFRCLCDPTKIYKNRKSFEKHMKEFHLQESISILS